MKKVWHDTKVLQDFETANVFWNIQMSFLFFFLCELLFLQLSFVWSNVYIWGCHLSETFIQCLPRNAAWSIPPASFPNLCSMQQKLRIACLSYAGTWSIKIYVAEELVWVGPAHTDDSFCYCCARGWHNKVKLSPLTWSAVSTKSVLSKGLCTNTVGNSGSGSVLCFKHKLMRVKWSLSCGINAEGSLMIKLLFFVSW